MASSHHEMSAIVPSNTSKELVSSPGGTQPSAVTIPISNAGGTHSPGLGLQLITAGVAACLADLMTFPMDTIKVRLQIQGSALGEAGPSRGVVGILGHIVRQEGLTALYSGIVPGLQRQMVFSSIRIGLYDRVKTEYATLSGAEGGVGMLGCRIAAGVTTGILGILVAQPTDVVKIRMQAAGKKGKYKGVVDAYRTIATNEGILNGLYKGTLPNICRNCIVNIGETVVYDQVKDALISSGRMEDAIPCHLASALVAGVTATLVASPVDVTKTRYMNSPKGTYKGAWDCATVTAKTEGARAFYKGFQVSCMRLVTWNVCLWLTYEQLKKQQRRYYANLNASS